jgi:hypothetical protein
VKQCLLAATATTSDQRLSKQVVWGGGGCGAGVRCRRLSAVEFAIRPLLLLLAANAETQEGCVLLASMRGAASGRKPEGSTNVAPPGNKVLSDSRRSGVGLALAPRPQVPHKPDTIWYSGSISISY